MYECGGTVRNNARALFLSLIACIVLALPSCAVQIDGIATEPKELDLTTRFTMVVSLSGDTCGAEARFYLDGNVTGTKMVGCDAGMVESREIDLSQLLPDCGRHVLRVDIMRSGSVVQNVSREVVIGRQALISFSSDAGTDRDMVINFRDAQDQRPIRSLNMRIYSVRKGPASMQMHYTDSDGDLVFRASETGEYVLSIDDSAYCGRAAFYVKRPLYTDGPYPPNPLVGELVTLTVPPGVGIKIIDAGGNFYAGCNTSFSGTANFTIEKSGNYTLVIGGSSMDYWGKNLTLHVSDKPGAELSLEPGEEIIRGRDVLIRASTAGGPLKNVLVLIRTPEQRMDEARTDANGSLIYVPASTGKHYLILSDDAYKTYEASFTARDALKIDYAPKQPRTDEDINVYVRDQLNSLVPDATVSVPGIVHGLTGMDGRFVFQVRKAGKYVIEAAKSEAFGAVQNVTVVSPITLEIIPAETETGGRVSIKARDSAEEIIDADFEVAAPDGSVVASGAEYVAIKTGVYTVRATKEGFIDAERNFSVTPHPMDEPAVGIMGDVMVINVTSRREPLAGIYVTAFFDAGMVRALTAENGSAYMRLGRDGKVRIVVNDGGENQEYGRSEVAYSLERKSDAPKPWSLSAIVAAAAVVVFAALLVVYVSQRRADGRGTGRGRGSRAGRSNASISRRK